MLVTCLAAPCDELARPLAFDTGSHETAPVTRRPSLIAATAVLLLVVLAGAMSVAGGAAAQDGVTIEISKHARLTSDGSVTFTATVVCGPLPGTLDFTEGLAGAGQAKTGAGAEGGLSPDVVCDGVKRVYTAGVSLITDTVFKRGPATAFVSVIACNVVGDEQVCVQASAQRRIIISGR